MLYNTHMYITCSYPDISFYEIQIFKKLFPTRKSLVSDIPAGDGKISNLFYSVESEGEEEDAKCFH